MPDGVRRLHVGEVGDRLQRGVELGTGQPYAQGWLRPDDGVPAADLVQAGEQRRRLAGEDVHDPRVELRPAPLPGHRDRGVRPAGPVKDLDHVGQGDQPGGHQDFLPFRPLRHALAVPALEGLLDAVANPLGQAQARGQRVSREPVVLQHRLGGPAAVTDEGHPEPGPLDRGPARAEVAEHEQRSGGRGGEIDAADIGLERRVVAEPLRLLVGIDVTAHPGQQGRVVHDLPVGLIQAQPLGQPQRDQALAQHVLHRLAHAEIGRQRQDAEQFGQADVRAGGGRCHSDEYKRRPSARTRVREHDAAHGWPVVHPAGLARRGAVAGACAAMLAVG